VSNGAVNEPQRSEKTLPHGKTYNIRLGERRIEAVKRYLAVEKGVPVYKIEEISFGSEKPIGPNDSRQAREQNRAVTLSILTPALNSASSASNR
jgi:flagellar motor protein MotB